MGVGLARQRKHGLVGQLPEEPRSQSARVFPTLFFLRACRKTTDARPFLLQSCKAGQGKIGIEGGGAAARARQALQSQDSSLQQVVQMRSPDVQSCLMCQGITSQRLFFTVLSPLPSGA